MRRRFLDSEAITIKQMRACECADAPFVSTVARSISGVVEMLLAIFRSTFTFMNRSQGVTQLANSSGASRGKISV